MSIDLYSVFQFILRSFSWLFIVIQLHLVKRVIYDIKIFREKLTTKKGVTTRPVETFPCVFRFRQKCSRLTLDPPTTSVVVGN